MNYPLKFGLSFRKFKIIFKCQSQPEGKDTWDSGPIFLEFSLGILGIFENIWEFWEFMGILGTFGNFWELLGIIGNFHEFSNALYRFFLENLYKKR
jgi:hypothetical protein